MKIRSVLGGAAFATTLAAASLSSAQEPAPHHEQEETTTDTAEPKVGNIATETGGKAVKALGLVHELPKWLAETLEAIPLNLIVVGDASGSYGIHAREENLKRFESLMDLLQPGSDYLQAYLLGMPLLKKGQPLQEFGAEEEVLTRTAGEQHFSESVRAEVLRKLDRRYGDLKGSHSDNLWVLKAIGSNAEILKGKQIPILVFFWDGEPNSPDDIDWAGRYPALANLPFSEQRAAYHNMMKEELKRLREMGVVIYVFTPPKAELPDYVPEVTDFVLSFEAGYEDLDKLLEDTRRRIAGTNFRRDIAQMIVGGVESPAVQRIQGMTSNPPTLEPPSAVAKTPSPDNEETPLSTKLGIAALLVALAALITLLLRDDNKKLREIGQLKRQLEELQQQGQEPTSSELAPVLSALQEVLAPVAEEAQQDGAGGDEIREQVEAVEDAIGRLGGAASTEQDIRPETVPAEERREVIANVIDELANAAGLVERGNRIGQMPNLDRAIQIGCDSREALERIAEIYNNFAHILEGYHEYYGSLSEAERLRTSPFLYLFEPADYAYYFNFMNDMYKEENQGIDFSSRSHVRGVRRPFFDENTLKWLEYHYPSWKRKEVLSRYFPCDRSLVHNPWLIAHQAYNSEDKFTPFGRGTTVFVPNDVFMRMAILDISGKSPQFIGLDWRLAPPDDIKTIVATSITAPFSDKDPRLIGDIELVNGIPAAVSELGYVNGATIGYVPEPGYGFFNEKGENRDEYRMVFGDEELPPLDQKWYKSFRIGGVSYPNIFIAMKRILDVLGSHDANLAKRLRGNMD